MSLGAVFDLAGMGMTAQSVRLNTTASNLANAQSAGGSEKEAYRARHAVFETVQRETMMGLTGQTGSMPAMDDAAVGIKVSGVVESDAPMEKRYEPHNPKANDEGYVFYPNVNVVEEMADMISASRSFQMNVEVMQAAKTMMQRVLSLGQ